MKTMELLLKLFVMLTTLLLLCSGHARGIYSNNLLSFVLMIWNNIKYYGMLHAGEVVISPLGMAPACLGEQLELICTTTGIVLDWKITLNDLPYSRLVSTTSANSTLNVSNIVFTFARTSSQNSLPLISVLLVNPVSAALNGSVVNCVNRETGRSSLTATTVIDENYLQGKFMYLCANHINICQLAPYFAWI